MRLLVLLAVFSLPITAHAQTALGALSSYGAITVGDCYAVGAVSPPPHAPNQALDSGNPCVPGAATQAQPSNPTAPASTSTYAMQGLAGTITPKHSGSVRITICATITNSSGTAGDGILFQISDGTGTAPANAASLTGTQVGQPMEYVNAAALTAADVQVPACTTAVITGLAIGTARWIDLAAKSVGTVSVTALTNVSVSAMEN